MPDNYISLSPWQLGIAASLVLINAGISLALGLGLERRLVIAATRTVVQLLVIGLILKWIFNQGGWQVVLLLMTAMTVIAGLAAVGRVGRRYPGIRWDSLLAVWVSSWAMAAVALYGVVQVRPWYSPPAQYAIPLLGMILGNTLNGITLGLDRLGEDLVARRDQVETLLALGATRWEAARGSVAQAVRVGMIPTLNSMMVVGLVSLPGMMTGQLLAGMDPVEAVKYQIVIMFLIAAGTALGCVMIVLLAYRRLFTADHQFLPHRLSRSAQ